MWDPLKSGPQYEKLSQAIIHAILSSEDVQARIAELQEEGALDGEDIIALALRFPPHGGLEAKVELMRKAVAEGAEEDEAEADPESKGPPSQDGAGSGSGGAKGKLTPNETAFDNFLQGRFDEEAWMKQAGIRFLPEDEKGIPLHEGESPKKEAE